MYLSIWYEIHTLHLVGLWQLWDCSESNSSQRWICRAEGRLKETQLPAQCDSRCASFTEPYCSLTFYSRGPDAAENGMEGRGGSGAKSDEVSTKDTGEGWVQSYCRDGYLGTLSYCRDGYLGTLSYCWDGYLGTLSYCRVWTLCHIVEMDTWALCHIVEPGHFVI